MNIKLFFFVVICFFSLKTLSAEEDLPPIALNYICIDFKHTKKDGIKICEIQLAKVSGGAQGIDSQVDRKGFLAELFCDTLKQYFTKICMISKSMNKSALYEKKAKQKGFFLYKSLDDFFKRVKSKKNFLSFPLDPLSLSSYSLLVTSTGDIKKADKIIKKKFPGILLIDKEFYHSVIKTASHNNNKENVASVLKNLMEQEENLKGLRPKSNVYPAKYSPELSQNIIEDINSDMFVIKPLQQSNGQGVFTIPKEELDNILQRILKGKMPKRIKKNKKVDKIQYQKYAFWEDHPQRKFIIEEFIESDPFISPLDNKSYDPTFRMFALLVHNNGNTDIFLLGSYIKLPKYSLEDDASFTSKHCSLSPPKDRFAVPLATKKAIEKQFYEILPAFYKEIQQYQGS